MLNRRNFLKTSMASLAAGASLNAAAAPERIRCAVLGLDHAHALDVVKVLRDAPDYELAGVCEPEEEVRARVKDEPAFRGLRWLSTDDLFSDDSIRMVAVESRVSRLLDLGRRVIDGGKHLHLDKPAGTSLPEFRALLDEAQRRDRLVQMGYMFRYNPGFDLVRQAVREGWLGDVYSIHASMSTDYDPAKRKFVAANSGSLMFELGSHLIDMIVLLLGEPAKVTPFTRHDGKYDDTLADNTAAILEWDRAIAIVESSAMETQAFPGRRFKVTGTKGTVTLTPLEPPAARLVLREPAGAYKAGEHAVPFEDLSRHVKDFADLAAAIRGEKKLDYTPQHDYNVQRTLLKAAGKET